MSTGISEDEYKYTVLGHWTLEGLCVLCPGQMLADTNYISLFLQLQILECAIIGKLGTE